MIVVCKQFALTDHISLISQNRKQFPPPLTHMSVSFCFSSVISEYYCCSLRHLLRRIYLFETKKNGFSSVEFIHFWSSQQFLSFHIQSVERWHLNAKLKRKML